MNLLCLAPDIQEAVLCMDRVQHGRDPVCETQLRPIAAIADWDRQREAWGSCFLGQRVSITEMNRKEWTISYAQMIQLRKALGHKAEPDF